MGHSDGENHEPLMSQDDMLTQVPYQSLRAGTPRRPSPERPAFSNHFTHPQALLERERERARKAQARPLGHVSANPSKGISRDNHTKGRNPASAERAVPEPTSSNAQSLIQTPLQPVRQSDSSFSTQQAIGETKTHVHASQHPQNESASSLNMPSSALAEHVLGSLLYHSPAIRELLRREPKVDTRQLMRVRDVCHRNKRAATDLKILVKELNSKAHQEFEEPPTHSTTRRIHGREHERSSSDKGLRTWTRKFNSRWLPSYPQMTKEQQAIVEKDTSWDPPLVGQPSIKGQVPLELLERLCRAADEIAMAKRQSIETGKSGATDEIVLGSSKLHNPTEATPATGDSTVQQTLPPTSSQVSWSQSEIVSPVRPRLPPDSSPFKSAANSPESRDTTKPPGVLDDSSASPLSGNQDISSSPPLPAINSEDEDSLLPDDDDDDEKSSGSPQPVLSDDLSSSQHESNAKSTVELLLEATSTRIREPSPVEESTKGLLNRSPEASVLHEEVSGGIVIDDPAKNSTKNSASQHLTSSLESSRSIQVSRTPAVQTRRSDPSNTKPEDRIDYMGLQESHQSLPQANLSQALPSSSFFVSGTSLPKPLGKDAATPSSSSHQGMPNPHLGWRKAKEEPTTDVMTETDQAPVEDLKLKRKLVHTIPEDYSKRRKAGKGPYVPKVRCNDPDMRESEFRLRQERHDWFEEQKERDQKERDQKERDQKERDRIGPEGQAHLAAAIKDDQSVESRERQLSTRSSVLSLAKQHVSTPLTHSSDYKLPATDKREQNGNGPEAILTKDNMSQDVFDSFKLHYPEYTGGQKQFLKACQLIRRLGQPHSSMWDDFVFRYNEEYLDYQATENEAGRLPLPYERYYNDYVEEPAFLSKVITKSYIRSLPDQSSIKESKSILSATSSRAPGLFANESINLRDSISSSRLKEPQISSPPLLVKDESHVSKADSPGEIYKSQRIDHSHDSSILIWAKKAALADPPDNAWREKLAGAESPELSTPPIPRDSVEVPMLDLETSASSPALAARPAGGIYPPPMAGLGHRRLPWKSPRETPLPAAPNAPGFAPIQRPMDKKGKAKALRRHTDFPVRRQEDVIDLTGPVVFQKPRPNAELPLVKLEMEFKALDGRRGLLAVPPRREVDIFSWRK